MALLSSWPFKIGLFLALALARLALYAYQKNYAPPRADGDDTAWLAETLDSFLLTIGLVFFIVQPFILQPFYIPSGSMENTLQWTPVQDRLLVSKMIYHIRDPRRGEVVVFRPPPAAKDVNSTTNLDDDFIKRCIGLPGDVVYANSKRQYFRNGKLLSEPYVKWSPGLNLISYDMKIVDGKVWSREYSSPGVPGPWVSAGVPASYEQEGHINSSAPEPVPDGMFLMLGDHRNNSSDGHAWGFVPRENLVGKAMCVFWPPNRIGTLDNMSNPKTPPTPTTTAPVGVSP